MRAMVFAAGRGTRLSPLTDERPKPGVPVANRPLACFALDALWGAGVQQVVMNTHHLGEMLPGLLAPHVPEGMRVQYVQEETLLGTGGGLRNAWPLLGRHEEPLYVMNSDILFAPDLAAAMATHLAHDAIATMVVRPDPEAARLGAVEVDAQGRVRRLVNRPAVVEGALTPCIFTGVHVLSARAFDDLPESGCIVRESYFRWMERGEVVAAHIDGSEWRDLGTLDAYLQSNLDLASGRLPWPNVKPGSDGFGARQVIGEGATVAPGVTLEDVVVWPGAQVERDLKRAIVTPIGVVQVP